MLKIAVTVPLGIHVPRTPLSELGLLLDLMGPVDTCFSDLVLDSIVGRLN